MTPEGLQVPKEREFIGLLLSSSDPKEMFLWLVNGRLMVRNGVDFKDSGEVDEVRAVLENRTASAHRQIDDSLALVDVYHATLDNETGIFVEAGASRDIDSRKSPLLVIRAYKSIEKDSDKPVLIKPIYLDLASTIEFFAQDPRVWCELLYDPRDREGRVIVLLPCGGTSSGGRTRVVGLLYEDNENGYGSWSTAYSNLRQMTMDVISRSAPNLSKGDMRFVAQTHDALKNSPRYAMTPVKGASKAVLELHILARTLVYLAQEKKSRKNRISRSLDRAGLIADIKAKRPLEVDREPDYYLDTRDDRWSSSEAASLEKTADGLRKSLENQIGKINFRELINIDFSSPGATEEFKRRVEEMDRMFRSLSNPMLMIKSSDFFAALAEKYIGRSKSLASSGRRSQAADYTEAAQLIGKLFVYRLEYDLPAVALEAYYVTVPTINILSRSIDQLRRLRKSVDPARFNEFADRILAVAAVLAVRLSQDQASERGLLRDALAKLRDVANENMGELACRNMCITVQNDIRYGVRNINDVVNPEGSFIYIQSVDWCLKRLA